MRERAFPFKVRSFLKGEVVDTKSCVGGDIGATVGAVAYGKTWDRIEVVLETHTVKVP